VIANGENGLHDSFELAEVDEKVLERGALVSEFPICQPSCTRKFPGQEPHHRRDADWRHHCGEDSEVVGVPGNVTQDVSFAPNLLIKQGAKLVTNAEDVIEELPTPVRAALAQLEAVESGKRDLLVADGLSST